MRSVINNFYLSKKKSPISSQRIPAQTVLKPISTTRFSFLTRGFNLRKIDSCVVWFSQCALKCVHVFKGIYNCVFGFKLLVTQGANFKQLRRMFQHQFLSNRTVAHSFLHKFYLFNNTCQLEAKRQLSSVIWGQFQATVQLRTLFCRRFT